MKYVFLMLIVMTCFVCGCDNVMGKDSAAKKSDVPIAVYGSL